MTMEKVYRDFNIVGSIRRNPREFETVKVENGRKSTELSYIVSTDEGDSMFLKFKCGFFLEKPNDFKITTKEGNEVQVAWEERTNQNILDMVDDYRKIKVNLKSSNYEDRTDYLNMFDVVNDLKLNLKDDTRVCIQMGTYIGTIWDKDKAQRKSFESKQLKSIRLANEDEKDKIEVKGQFLINSNSLELQPNGDIKVNGFVSSSKRNDDGTRTDCYEPYLVNINKEELALTMEKNTGTAPTDETITKVVEMYKGFLACPMNETRKVSFTMKYVNKSSYIAPTEKDLNDQQRLLIELGTTTLEAELKKLSAKKGDEKRYIAILSPNFDLEGGNTFEKVDVTDDELMFNPFKVSNGSIDEALGQAPAPTNNPPSQSAEDLLKNMGLGI